MPQSDTNLPSSRQVWSHSTNSRAKLRQALQEDSSITAIEADLLMGQLVPLDDPEEEVGRGGGVASNNYNQPLAKTPIMSHDSTSDLSMTEFLQALLVKKKTTNNRSSSTVALLRKHVKLDFKEILVVPPTLHCLHKLGIDYCCTEAKTVFLNADILPGPGRTIQDITVPPNEFLRLCIDSIPPSDLKRMAFSLGFKVDVTYPWGHTQEMLERMAELIQTHDLWNRSAGIVLPISARLLVKNTKPFVSFLNRYPQSQLLVWTGTGEPPVSSRKVNLLKNKLTMEGIHDSRIGLDCQVEPNPILGFFYDVIVDLYGIYMLVRTRIVLSMRNTIIHEEENESGMPIKDE